MTALLVAASALAGVVVACGGSGASVGVVDDEAGSDAAVDSALANEDASLSDDDHHDPLNGVDAGCLVKRDGPRAGSVAANVMRNGAASNVEWSIPENARVADGQFARATLDTDQTSALLRITQFGFQVPATARVLGIEVQFKRQASDTGIGDGNIELWLDGAASDRPKFLATAWPRLIVGTHHYGQATDPWGNDLTPALVGRPGFGVEIFARRLADAGTGPLEARIDSMRVTVFYCD